MTQEATGNVPPETAEQTNESGSDDRPLDAEKLLRLANLAGQVLEEARKMDPDDEGTAQGLAALHDRVTSQLYGALPNFLVEELEAMDLNEGFADGASPQEVRIAYAGLIGWLGGLLQGLQTAMQMSHINQLHQARHSAGAIPPGSPSSPSTGQYL